MNSNPEPRRKLPRVGLPAVRARVTVEPVLPLEGPVATGPLIPVRGLVVRASAAMEPVEPAVLEAAHSTTADGEHEVGRLSSFIEKLNEADSIFNRPGLRIDESRSGVRDGRVVLVLTPNDPADAFETCKRVADYLFAVIRTIPGATVRVFVADQPDTPVYELAS